MPREKMRLQKQELLNTCTECFEQATGSCALCRTALCRHHRYVIQKEVAIEQPLVMLCSACHQALSVSIVHEELCDYIALYNPKWALA